MNIIQSIVTATFLAPTILLAKPEKPNVLILYADDLGFGDLTCYNEKSKIPTPNLDKLASEGIRFTDGHSSSGICTPSRYALLTGRHHWRDFHGIVGAMGNSVFKKERITLPELLKENGYHTAAIGKWHLGWDWNAIRIKKERVKGTKKLPANHFSNYDWSKPIPNGPLDHGFDYYFGDTVINFPPYAWIENDKLVKAPDTMMNTGNWKKIKEGNWECRPGPARSDWDPYQNIPVTTAKAVDYIKKQAESEKPFFLYFAFPAPHAPIIPNDEFDGKSKAGAYGDFVVETDDACGKILTALKESGQAENTIVIFSADNGPEHYALARDQKYDHWSSAPLRGMKRDIYEGGHHVPFIIRYPKMGGGKTNDALVSQIDIMATVASAIGVSIPNENTAEDSHDLMPLLTGEAKTVRTSHVHNTKKNHYAIRHGDWLLVDAKSGYLRKPPETWNKKHNMPADDQQPVELYNLKEDIGQRNNIASKHPERVKELQKLLKKIREDGHSAPRLEAQKK